MVGFKEPLVLGISKKLQKVARFHERTGQRPAGLGGYLNFFQKNLRTVGLSYTRVFDFLITMGSHKELGNRFIDNRAYLSNPGNLCLITMAINFDTRINPWPPGGLVQFVIPAPTLV